MQYIGDGVAAVEIALNLGMYVSGLSGVPSDPRGLGDVLDYITGVPCAPPAVFLICEASEIVQSLIAEEAALTLMTRERRLGAGDAIKIVDGDIAIDTSVNQRYLRDFVNDFSKDHNRKMRWTAHNLLEGYSLRQLDEMAIGAIQRGAAAPWTGQYGF